MAKKFLETTKIKKLANIKIKLIQNENISSFMITVCAILCFNVHL